MPRFILFCLVSSQLAMTAVVARPFAVFLDGGAMSSVVADAPSAPAVLHAHSLLEESRFAGSPLGSHHSHHSPFDRTFAGGKIIVTGLAAAIVVAIFCYLRITRTKKNVEVEPKV
ncbi:hypothetical protein SETIT_2G345700v2 [Setaria italica]|uniref:Transmembrane protein n=1 Tax=Setaria italica TaxID=4555 RepID=K3ZY77_SETIT|nr:uncharacterized protein LOC101762517 [Setaria italica]RCV13426.1 hypothetical protein SETIT_2G345700v2 [Setaria italica]